MEGRELPHMDRHREVMNDWNFDGICTVGFGLVKFLVLSFCCTEIDLWLIDVELLLNTPSAAIGRVDRMCCNAAQLIVMCQVIDTWWVCHDRYTPTVTLT